MEQKSAERRLTVSPGLLSRRRVLAIVIATATVFVVIAALLTPGRSPQSGGIPHGTGPTVNSFAPDFTLTDVNGKPLQLSKFRGQVVLLNFWYVACEPCRIEMPALERVYQQKHALGFVVIGVDTSDDAAVANAYLQQLGITYPVVLDHQGAAASAYQIVDTPTSFLIDARGVVNYRVVGPIDEKSLLSHLQSLL